MALRSEGVPPAAVYLVRPLSMAALAASLMNWGVSKSGSPAPMAITSLPSDFRRAALAVTARVGDGLMAFRRLATNDMRLSCNGLGIAALVSFYRLGSRGGRDCATRLPSGTIPLHGFARHDS